MKSYYINLEIIGLFMLSLIPWPGPTVFKISCPRESARIVRKLIQNKWTPILEKYKVTIPLECPFHPIRDIFGPQQAAKYQYRSTQWTCGICGKSFFEEKYLDIHFDNRHKEYINVAEDAVCLADYCDLMRCDVLATQDPKIVFPETLNTDVEIWREASSLSKSLITPNTRDVAKYTIAKHGTVYTNLATKSQHISLSSSATSSSSSSSSKSTSSSSSTTTSTTTASSKQMKEKCVKSDAPSANDNDDNSNDNDGKSQNKSFNTCQSDLVDSALPAPNNKQQRIAELQKLKANCKPEELQKLKTKCEILVRDCIASLLIQLSLKDFKEVEDELNRAVCWYLTCDRYWEDSQADIRQFPWGLLCMIIMVLSLGICMCYYIIWVLFDTDDVSVTSASVTDRSTPSPAHALRQEITSNADGTHIYTEDYYASTDKDNEYIYVTYPPDLKRRLLESCYNRTTRL